MKSIEIPQGPRVRGDLPTQETIIRREVVLGIDAIEDAGS